MEHMVSVLMVLLLWTVLSRTSNVSLASEDASEPECQCAAGIEEERNELREELESAKHRNKNVENELADISARFNQSTLQVAALTNDKGRMEAAIAHMKKNLKDALTGWKTAEQKARTEHAKRKRLAKMLRKERRKHMNPVRG